MHKTIYIKDDLYNELERYLKKSKISFSRLVAKSLNSYLNKELINERPKDFFKINNSYKDIFPDVKELRKDLIEPKD